MKKKADPIIIGFGPAGMFAALELIEHGFRPLIFERGKKIEERSADVQKFITGRILNPESNIQFGEGGAGSYSDGKLFSRPGKNNKYAQKVLDTFVKFGAPEDITRISKPHLGTDLLCVIAANIRRYILERGGEINYSSKMTDLLISGGKAAGVVINEKNEYRSPAIFLALGHSARDTFEMLDGKAVVIEQRAISVGVRIEHPVEIIRKIRRGDPTYSFTYTNREIGRGVYTFCMCPGGEVVNASSEPGMLVVNGMSYSARSSKFSNSAIVVTCRTEDYGSPHPLAGIEFQRVIEKKAFDASGGSWKAPGQNLIDFLAGNESKTLNENSFKMGVEPFKLGEIFPKFINEALTSAFAKWESDYPLFVSEHALLIGAETRHSCPIKIIRNNQFESESIRGLHPVGEGSGYTGGITSSAADAIQAVETARLGPF